MQNSGIVEDRMVFTSCNICCSDEYREICNIIISPPFVLTKLVKCKTCGFFYGNPILKRETQEDFYRKYCYDHPQKNFWYETRINVFKRSLRKMGKFLEKGRLIDVGCGMGYFMDLAKNNGWEVNGVEISGYAINHVRERLGLNIKKTLKDAQFETEYFDAATMWNVLDQIYDPRTNLIELNRILKKGGYLFIRVPNLSFHLMLLKLYNRLRILIKKIGNPPAVFHLYSFDKDSIKKLLESTGFSDVVVNIESMGVNIPTFVKVVGIKKEKILRNFFDIGGKFLYFLSLKKIIMSPSIFVIARKKE